MLPYQAVAMDYTGYQRQGHQAGGVPGVGGGSGHMGMGSLGMGGGPPFSHSWLVPTQDLCASSPYKAMPGQHQSAMQQPLEPGHVTYLSIYVIIIIFKWECDVKHKQILTKNYYIKESSHQRN